MSVCPRALLRVLRCPLLWGEGLNQLDQLSMEWLGKVRSSEENTSLSEVPTTMET